MITNTARTALGSVAVALLAVALPAAGGKPTPVAAPYIVSADSDAEYVFVVGTNFLRSGTITIDGTALTYNASDWNNDHIVASLGQLVLSPGTHRLVVTTEGGSSTLDLAVVSPGFVPPACAVGRLLMSQGNGQYVCGPVYTCPANLGNCNGNDTDGCEANLLTDSSNCGTCGNVCSSGSCSNGACPVVSPAALVISPTLQDYSVGERHRFTVLNTGEQASGVMSVTVSGPWFKAFDTCMTPYGLVAHSQCYVDVDLPLAVPSGTTGYLTVSASPGGTVHSSLTSR